MIGFSWNAPCASVSKDLQAKLCLVASRCSKTMHKRIFAFPLLAVVTNAQQQPLEPLTKYRASLFRRALQSFCPFARADPQEDQRWPACLFDAASRFASRLHSRKTVRCSLRPQFSSIHGRASQTHGFRQLRKPACRIALQLRILMGFAFCIDGPREDWHQISRSQEQNGVSWKNRLPVQVVRAGATAPPRQNGNSSF